MVHMKSGTEMAVKRIRSTVDEREQKRLLMDLDVVCIVSKLVVLQQCFLTFLAT